MPADQRKVDQWMLERYGTTNRPNNVPPPPTRAPNPNLKRGSSGRSSSRPGSVAKVNGIPVQLSDGQAARIANINTARQMRMALPEPVVDPIDDEPLEPLPEKSIQARQINAARKARNFPEAMPIENYADPFTPATRAQKARQIKNKQADDAARTSRVEAEPRITAGMDQISPIAASQTTNIVNDIRMIDSGTGQWADLDALETALASGDWTGIYLADDRYNRPVIFVGIGPEGRLIFADSQNNQYLLPPNRVNKYLAAWLKANVAGTTDKKQGSAWILLAAIAALAMR